MPGVLILLVMAADWLLYRNDGGGLGWAVLLGLVALAVFAPEALSLNARALTKRGFLALAALLPLLDNVSPLSLFVSLCLTAILVLYHEGQAARFGAALVRQIAGFFLLAPFRLLFDLLFSLQRPRPTGRRQRLLGHVLTWSITALFGGVFVLLFATANPLIDRWLTQFDLGLLLNLFEPARLAFWIVVAMGLYAFLRPYVLPPRNRPVREVSNAGDRTLLAAFFNRAALLRALLVFNGLFAIQNGLDATYLWGGAALPDGMTYASYAHRGAYPLIATALLAGGFVLIAMRPGAALSRDHVIRSLVYVWTAQNIWLVASSILRLDLYVDAYALTYWRVAAFVWMGLVGVGLALILARIALEKSNGWLVTANLAALSAVLYCCCFINFAGRVADFNVAHGREAGGVGLPVDLTYLADLGPQTIPALDRLIALRGPIDPACRAQRAAPCAAELRDHLAAEVSQWRFDWRNWTVRNIRLMDYVANTPSIPAPATVSKPGAGPE
ncbi:DUF4173 domain-containing protein [Salmonella enterica subsp. enterica]|nr:DUF4173 domain-containing protein [Salmonella enterica subsp. enterica serovar Java]MIL09113.1 DUF4173 domain-containing protein [Salmonella enterica subsp. enterica serovar Enteritidis]